MTIEELTEKYENAVQQMDTANSLSDKLRLNCDSISYICMNNAKDAKDTTVYNFMLSKQHNKELVSIVKKMMEHEIASYISKARKLYDEYCHLCAEHGITPTELKLDVKLV